MDAFLTNKEKRKLQRMYENWNKYAKGDVLMERFYSEGLLHERDRSEFSAKRTIYEKNEFLYDTVLNRSTYDRICTIREILRETEDSGHKELARLLPRRPEIEEPPDSNMQWENYSTTPGSEKGNNNTSGHGYNGGNSSRQDQRPSYNEYQHDHTRQGAGEGPSSRDNQHHTFQQEEDHDQKYSYGHQPRKEATSKTQNTPPPESFLESRYGIQTETYKETFKTSNNQPQTTYPEPRPPRATVDTDCQPPPNSGKKLGIYPVRSNKPKGNGLCIIFANFTKDLAGYKNDLDDITNFFQSTLKYTVLGGSDQDNHEYRNLNTPDFKRKLRAIKLQLQEGNLCNTDRLFVFILSHGDEFGIKMMPPDDQDHSVRDRVKTEEIVNTFTHDALPNLKGFPKCFFIQVCRGVELAQAANKPAAQADDSEMDTSGSEVKSQIVAIGADTLVCHAAKEGTYSWVTDTKHGQKPGSWFLQATIEVFRKYHEDEHVLDMMTEVNDVISKKKGQAMVIQQGHTRRTKVNAYQLPAVSNNLTKKLFL